MGGNSLIYNESEDAYYIQHGADAVPKKLQGSSAELLWTNPSVQNQVSITATCNWTKYDKIIVLLCGSYLDVTNNKCIQCFDVGATSAISYKSQMYRVIEFGSECITMYVPSSNIGSNWGAYNIPLKIWGLNMEIDFYSYP